MSELIIVRGGGDLATGVIQKLFRAGFQTLILETEMPLAIRRTVSVCDAVYFGSSKVEDVECVLIKSLDEMEEVFKLKKVPMIVDPTGNSIEILKPFAVVDAILAKKNLGTNMKMAEATIALGPGFYASKDVDIVIETMRGHDLGRLIFEGTALPNTGIPGEIGGKSAERVIHSPAEGKVRHIKKIGDVVEKGETIFFVEDNPVRSPFKGLIRGLISEKVIVKKGLKVADIDPRLDVDFNTISDKARNLGGAVLESIMYLKNR